MKKLLLLLLPLSVYAKDDYTLTSAELELLKKASILSPVEKYDPKRQYPDTINDSKPKPIVKELKK